MIFFYYYYFCIFLRTRNSIATPPKCCDKATREIASKAATLNKPKEKQLKNKPNLPCCTLDLRSVTQSVVPFSFFRARVYYTLKTIPQEKRKTRRKTKRWEFNDEQLAGRASSKRLSVTTESIRAKIIEKSKKESKFRSG